MYHFKNLTNKVFGRLTVLEKLEKRAPNRHILWKCKCSCGREKITSSNSLQTGHVQSCGCLRKESEKLRNRKRPYEFLYNFVKRVAEKRRHEFDLSYEQFLNFTRVGQCHYCYKPIIWSEHATRESRRNMAYHLDRVNNERGYIFSNLVVCCTRCNVGRNQYFTYEEWYRMTEPFRTGELKHEQVS